MSKELVVGDKRYVRWVWTASLRRSNPEFNYYKANAFVNALFDRYVGQLISELAVHLRNKWILIDKGQN